ncbi:MAG: formate--tetrahydrofolate ligase [Candidatus Omnitrophica bacterium]|nr:formate--tetrahydrofolate ligase [Candidatus Omnitrophota bacterium]MDD5436527.1 formate--tetrahydrofolate ligase [Candidatus Omnitrophota bacterium]
MIMKSDVQIASEAKLKPISSIAAKLGIPNKYIECYGYHKAKVSIDILKALKPRKKAKYIVVTGITPTHLGEGKTVTTVGLAMALDKIGGRSVACLRQPSMGPFFGIKGGGVGGGYSQVSPEDDINLHLTGDIHAVTQAHNLAASFLDNHLYRGNSLKIDPAKIYWRRVMDVNDRALRNIRIGLGGGENGVERDTGFDITAASEIMAILALTDSISDMRKRLGRMILALTRDAKPVTCDDIKVAGSMAAILTDAINPNLVQTIENTPALIHTGPFANITHGNSSILADRIALSLCDYVVTESGFGADCGLEKFVNIKCRTSGLMPSCAVLVASVRALKIHSGMFKMVVGRPLVREILSEHLDALEVGCANLEKQIENVRVYGIPCVVAINRFETDTDREIELVRRKALEAGAFHCVTSGVHRYGSRGGLGLAKAVIDACEAPDKVNYLYPLDVPIEKKIETIAKMIYGAKGVHFEKLAEENIRLYKKMGLAKLPICMAKTHLSLSHDPKLKGSPRDFILPVRDVRPSVGAGFLYALCGKILTMPSLPSRPVGERIDIDAKGRLIYK